MAALSSSVRYLNGEVRVCGEERGSVGAISDSACQSLMPRDMDEF